MNDSKNLNFISEEYIQQYLPIGCRSYLVYVPHPDAW